MESKNKALKLAVTAVVILAVAMFAYYKLAWRARTTENDVNFQEKGEVAKVDEKSELTGLYAASDPIEGLDRRLGFFSVNKKEDGAGYSGTAKMDSIATTQDSAIYVPCDVVNLGEKEFFLKCGQADLGEISFTGEWQKNTSGTVQVTGKILWSKDGAVVLDKPTNLQRSTNN